MYLSGVGMTKFGTDDRTTHDLIYEATMEALDDADMNIDDIDAVALSTIDNEANGERQRHAASLISSLLKIQKPIVRVPAGCGGGGAAFWTALQMEYENILVLGGERLAASTTSNITDELMTGAERIYEQAEGLNFPGQNALVAQQHMMQFGTTSDDLALVALKNHEHANLNPKAGFYGKKVTLEKIKNSPVVASPLRLFDCSFSINGAAACVVTQNKTDIKIIGAGTYTDYLTAWERGTMTSWDATVQAANQAFSQAGIDRSGIDFAEVHDAFTPVELINYEDLGFCKKGEGASLIRDGKTKLDGSLPINTSGGLKARGHPISATGVSQIYEVAKQLRGEAQDRQLSRANIGLAHNIGGAGATSTVHIFQKVSA